MAAFQTRLAPSVSLAGILDHQCSSAFKCMLLLSAVLRVLGHTKSPHPCMNSWELQFLQVSLGQWSQHTLGLHTPGGLWKYKTIL